MDLVVSKNDLVVYKQYFCLVFFLETKNFTLSTILSPLSAQLIGAQVFIVQLFLFTYAHNLHSIKKNIINVYDFILSTSFRSIHTKKTECPHNSYF